MSCDNCAQANPIPVCSDETTVGEVQTMEDVYVYFESQANGRVDRYEATPDTGGDVTIVTPELSTETSYKVWITEQGSTDQETGLTITLDQSGTPTDVNCYLIRFTNPQAGDYPLIVVNLKP